MNPRLNRMLKRKAYVFTRSGYSASNPYGGSIKSGSTEIKCEYVDGGSTQRTAEGDEFSPVKRYITKYDGINLGDLISTTNDSSNGEIVRLIKSVEMPGQDLDFIVYVG